jgi:hypothetical protein
MNELVLRHTYENGLAFDISGHLNHGTPVGVTRGTGDFAGSFRFGGGPSRVVVAPSPTLADLRSIRARVRFSHQPETPMSGGELLAADASFRLYVAEALVFGSLVDAAGNTAIVQSSTDLTGDWNEVELIHDGISELRLVLDGALVAVQNDVPGPVRGVGPGGIVVGHRLDLSDDNVAFEGYIDDVSLHRYDPRKDIERLVDLCCLDRESIDDLLKRVREDGWDAERLGNKVRDLLDLGSEIAAAARADDAARIEEHRRLAREVALTLQSPDRRALYEVIDRLDASVREELSQSQLEAYGQRVAAQVADWPFSLTDLVEIAPGLCWERFLPPGFGRPVSEEEEGEEGAEDERAPEWPAGDPDTDRSGDRPPDDWVQGGEEPPGARDDEGHVVEPPEEEPGRDEERGRDVHTEGGES